MKYIDTTAGLSLLTIFVCTIGGSLLLFAQPSPQSPRPAVPAVVVATTAVPVVAPTPKPPVVNTTRVALFPEKIIQGDPVMLRIGGGELPTKILFNGAQVIPFLLNTEAVAFIGIDLNQKPGTYIVLSTFADGSMIKTPLVIAAREKIDAPLGIPEKLGGNTAASQKKLVETLATENASLLHLKTEDHPLWTAAFGYPLANPVVTDNYGYTRQTGEYSIAHKGTDFHADEGTPIVAMNDGVVRLVRTYTEYGNTIVVDHGLGLMTFYMHLSKIEVKAGEKVTKGQEIGLSGQTGYADQPHLHLTVRINDISIDPIVFLNLFK